MVCRGVSSGLEQHPEDLSRRAWDRDSDQGRTTGLKHVVRYSVIVRLQGLWGHSVPQAQQVVVYECLMLCRTVCVTSKTLNKGRPSGFLACNNWL